MEQTLEEQIHDIVSRFIRPSILGELVGGPPVLDISKPNIHDSKRDLSEEKEAVEAAMASIRSLILLLFPRQPEEENQKAHLLAKRLRTHLDADARQRVDDKRVETPVDLVAKNAADVGITASAVMIKIEIWSGLHRRSQELKNQEKTFWSSSSRPPNHYARTIALRLARIVAQETGELPTIGVSREGNHPSTDYGKALEEVFALLNIKADFRRAGKWAVKQLTEEDLSRPYNALRIAGNLGLVPPYQGQNALAGLLDTFAKEQDS